MHKTKNQSLFEGISPSLSHAAGAAGVTLKGFRQPQFLRVTRGQPHTKKEVDQGPPATIHLCPSPFVSESTCGSHKCMPHSN